LKSVKKEIITVCAGTFILTFAGIAIAALLKRFSISAIVGGFLGAAVASLNFIFLAATLKSALKKDAQQAKMTVAISLFLRYISILILSVIFILLGANAIAVLIPLLFPRIVIFITQIHKTGDKNGY
jgi:predicted neutral ceramidase superfamily lipid hydrolase